jgi:hypothetical protein
VQDLDREVLALLAEDLAGLLLEDLARPVMGVDDVVADVELDRGNVGDEVLDLLVDALLRNRSFLLLGLQVSVHEVDLL